MSKPRTGFAERLSKLSRSLPPSPTSNRLGVVENVIDDLDRILALPKRPPVVCERDRRTKRYPPATQALIEVQTAKYSRGPRLSCACRPRRVTMADDGTLVIWRVLPDGFVPEPPVSATVREFVADNRRSEAELSAARTVMTMRPGAEVSLPSADGSAAGHPCITTLNALQAWTLHEAPLAGGIVGFKGVGSGKTISGLLAPLAFPDCNLAVMAIEPKQRQHYKSHYYWLREHFRVTTINFDDGETIIVPGTPSLHLISYSVLSLTSSSKLLDDLAPDVMVLDEAHKACGDSAINRRVKRYCEERIIEREGRISRGEPVRDRALRLLDWSGTLENKSVEDTQMLSAYSLGVGSPLPLDPHVATSWSGVFDTSYKPDYVSSTSKKLQRAFAGREYDATSLDNLLVSRGPEEEIRRGFRKRRVETLGVITGNSSSVNASIYLSERKVPEIPDAVKRALTQVRMDWLRPDGDDLVEKVAQVACARQVACGFYSYWAFPKHPCTCPKPIVPGAPRCEQCLLIEDWYAKRKAYSKELRTRLHRGEVHLDSPKLCEEAAERFWREPPYEGKLPKWDSETWPAWSKIKDRVEHEERVKWIDDFLARDAAKWALEHRGVVWFQSIAFGRRVAELTGLSYHNGGPGGEARLAAETGKQSVICSLKANASGTDGLQHKFYEQLLAEIPASNSGQTGFEQLFGRLHRDGQPADVVKTEAYLHVPELMDALRGAIAQAEFNEHMTGNRQRLLFCDMEVDGL